MSHSFAHAPRKRIRRLPQASFKAALAGTKGNNGLKTRVWLALFLRDLHGLPGLSIAEMVAIPCLSQSYASLNAELPRWVSWDYLARRPGEHNGRACYIYHLAARGFHWLDEKVPRSVYFPLLEEMSESTGLGFERKVVSGELAKRLAIINERLRAARLAQTTTTPPEPEPPPEIVAGLVSAGAVRRD